MTLYAQSDLTNFITPVEAGGCGREHRKGSAKIFKLDCPRCEAVKRGDRKPKILKYQIDPKTGQTLRQERVADSDPQWSSTPETIPLTVDEQRVNATRTERGRMQIEMIQALASVRAMGIQVPPDAMFLLEREIPAEILHGTVVCVNSHDNPAGVKFCGECAAPMKNRAAIAAPEEPKAEPAAADLDRVHPQTLKKMCREKGLPDKGSKEQLVGRLQAAA